MTSPPAVAAMARPSARVRDGLRALHRRGRALAFSVRHAAGGRCAVCRAWCDGGLCAPCDGRFAFARERCSGCAMPIPPRVDVDDATTGTPAATRCLRCRLSPPAWSRAVAGVDYGYPWDGLLADFKFHQRLDHVDVLLAPLLARLRNGAQDDAAPSALRVVPVPLARERLRERGYNQSWELARRVARALSLDARPDALFRVRDTSHQLGLHRSERDANLRGAFVVAPDHAAWVRGAAVVLVDDVLTTGATARAAARTLLAAGARDVQVWVVARTPD